jgi:hypothetical protein
LCTWSDWAATVLVKRGKDETYRAKEIFYKSLLASDNVIRKPYSAEIITARWVALLIEE